MKTILENIANDKEIQKSLSKMNYPLTNDEFLATANNYIDAIREGRMFCTIPKVSASGMSRQIKFNSFEIYSPQKENSKKGYYRQYWAFFKALGYKEVKGSNTFSIGGCGMDMIFHTNYTIIHKLHRLGFIDEAECESLAQQTPTVL